MRTIICGALLLLAATIHGQDSSQTRDHIIKWLQEKVLLYGRVTQPYTEIKDDIERTVNVETLATIDTCMGQGIIWYYGEGPSSRTRQRSYVYFRLTDIVYIQKSQLHDKRAIEVHVDSAQIVMVLETGSRTDTIRPEARVHTTIDIVLQWRKERRLYQRTYYQFLQLIEMNKKNSNLYTLGARGIDSFCKYR